MAKMKPIAAGRHPKKKGAMRMQEMGYRQVQLWLDQSELAVINKAAKKDGKRLATWIRQMSLLVAQGKEYTRP